MCNHPTRPYFGMFFPGLQCPRRVGNLLRRQVGIDVEDLLTDLRLADQLPGPHRVDAGSVIPKRADRRVVGDTLPTYWTRK